VVNNPQTQVSIASIVFANPVMTASGTFGYGEEFKDFLSLKDLGAIVVKGISYSPRCGNPPPRIVETACGMLNAIGLENVGVERFIAEKMPFLQKIGGKTIVNILGESVEEYCAIVERLNDVEGIAAIELNISCPNVKKGGVAFGTDTKMAAEVTRAVKNVCKVPLIVKLSPNVTDITQMARAVQEGGADAVSLINTLIGMAIDIGKRKPVLANTIGGLSGPAIKPVALRMVWQVYRAVEIPVIGIGGISKWQDAIEFILAGATAVQVGTANFVNPNAAEQIRIGISRYLVDNNIGSVTDIIGGAHPEKEKCLRT
jgi:dihydroorotate dehydrogenase (NAD+) catalytic subunit